MTKRPSKLIHTHEKKKCSLLGTFNEKHGSTFCRLYKLVNGYKLSLRSYFPLNRKEEMRQHSHDEAFTNSTGPNGCKQEQLRNQAPLKADVQKCLLTSLKEY